MGNSFVSVVMPVYNCELYLKEAITSILNQTYTNFELLIIDDASTDATKSIINTFEDSRINFIEKPTNTGYTDSLNYGLSLARGKYIARMDGDDICFPERFAKQVTFLEACPDVVVCGTNYEIIGSRQVKLLPEKHEEIKIELLKNTCFGHPTVMIRKKILDENKLKYNIEKEPAEDYALWVTLLSYGKFYNLQEELLHYRVHKAQVSQKRRTNQLKSKLSTRIKILEYLVGEFKEDEYRVLEKVLFDNTLCFDELLVFIKIKKNLIKLNKDVCFFKLADFAAYLNDLESSVIIKYFLLRKQFTPVTYRHYLKIKKQSHFRLPLKTNMIFLVKSLLFFKTNKD